jgi:hypothetical protein
MANAPTLDALIQQIGPLAKQYGVTEIVIVARDPQTGAVKLFGETVAQRDAKIREVVREKFAFDSEPETAWNDV